MLQFYFHNEVYSGDVHHGISMEYLTHMWEDFNKLIVPTNA